MGLFSKITRSITKPLKKVIKSPVGLTALAAFGLPAYARYGQGLPGTGVGGFFGKGSKMAQLGKYLYGSAGTPGVPDTIGKAATKGLLTKNPAITAGVGTALTAGAVAPELEEKVDIDVDDPTGHANYLTNRGMYEDEWAEWLVSSGKAETKEEALELVRNNPMFSGGGRVKANTGLYAGGMGGMNQGMNPMTMNQGLGGMNAMGMGSPSNQMRQMGGQDPRMAKMNQMQNINRGIQSVKPPTQSEDAELIQLIKMLTSMGIPMEQLRGRTKEELVELVVSVKGKMQGERGVKETAEVIEEEDIREQNQAAGGGLMRTGYAMGSAPTDTVVEESENIELAGTDTPAEDLEDLQELRDSFFDVHGREPASIDELKLFLRIRRQATNQGGLMRTGYAMGTSQFGLMGNEHPIIPSKDGNQLDMRQTGGYQPHGKAEKHDDVRALLAQGEFVMTSDAVKGMGGGDREAGAKKMYDLMHNMEAMA